MNSSSTQAAGQHLPTPPCGRCSASPEPRRWSGGLLASLGAAGLLALLALGGCAGLAPAGGAAPLSQARTDEILAAPDRTPADRVNDRRRLPSRLLPFIGPRPGQVALDVSAGGGYTSELLARAIGPTGQVFGQSQPRNLARNTAGPAAPEGNSNPNLPPPPPAAVPAGTPPAAVPAGTPPAAVPAGTPPAAAPASPPRTSATALRERQERLAKAGVAAAPITPVERRFEDPVPPELAEAKLDLVTLMFNYHDLGHLGTDRAAMNRALFRALKPGGVYVIADHAGRPGTGIGEAGTLHRIEEAFLRAEVEAAGFKLLASGDFLRNPNDPRDRNTPEPPQPKDEFVLKFVKP